MHASPLAFEANAFASVVSMIFAAMLAFGYRCGFRHLHLYVLVVGWMGLCLYFALLAISAGEHPVIERASFATFERVLLIFSFLLLLIGTIKLSITWWRRSGHRIA